VDAGINSCPILFLGDFRYQIKDFAPHASC
jgi:hypothetical protein